MAENPCNKLDGQTAVVTGASSGIGRAIALELAAAGCHVVVHANTSGDRAEAVAEEVRRQGPESTVLLADLTKPEATDQLVADAWQWRGGVDIWVNNAGADVLTGPRADWTFEEKLDLLFQLDVNATIRLGRSVGQRMKAAASGAILNIGWDGADRGMQGDSGQLFAAAKGAVTAFTRSLAQSLAPEVRVNCVAPGWIKTAWGENAPDEWQQRAERESLLARWGTPEDVARVARFLVGPESGFVTGQIIDANGGFRWS